MTDGLLATRVAAIDARVVRNTPLCRDHVAIEVAVTDFPESAPGQFLQLLCADVDDAPARAVDWPAEGWPSFGRTASPRDADGGPVDVDAAMLRRPFSIADRWESSGQTHLLVISRAVGPGTRWLARLTAGDTLNLTGPLGRGFEIPADPPPLVLVGGGVGIPPLLYLCRALQARGIYDVTCIFGAMSRDLFPIGLTAPPASDGTPARCLALPGDAPFEAVVTTDDGTLGLRGYTTTALRQWAERRRAATVPAEKAGSRLVARRPLILACGPDGMLRAVAKETRALEMDCQLCIEKPMGCGLGTCLSCVTQVFDANKPAGWRWALACTEGPVFSRDVLVEYADRPPAAG